MSKQQNPRILLENEVGQIWGVDLEVKKILKRKKSKHGPILDDIGIGGREVQGLNWGAKIWKRNYCMKEGREREGESKLNVWEKQNKGDEKERECVCERGWNWKYDWLNKEKKLPIIIMTSQKKKLL